MNDHFGSHLKVGVHMSALSVRYNVSDNGTVINATAGFEYNILTTLAAVLNFSFTLVDNDEISFGNKDENGSWVGTIAEIAKGELDLALSTMGITRQRLEVIDFTPPYLMDHVAFFVKPQRNYEKGIFFIETFTVNTWTLVFVYLITYALILRVLLKPKRYLNVVTFVLANILKQGYNLPASKSHHLRISITILLVFWFMTSTIILIYYGTFLTSSASLHNHFTIKSLSQLCSYFERGEMKMGILERTNARERTAMIMGARKYEEMATKASLDVLIELMLEGKVAILADVKSLMLYMHEKRIKNNYHFVKEWIFYEYIAMPLRKNFSRKKEFGRIINLLKDTGCLHKWENDLKFDFQRSERKKELSEKEGYSPINETDFKSAFTLFFGGLLICFLIFNTERATKMYRAKRMYKMTDKIVETSEHEDQNTTYQN